MSTKNRNTKTTPVVLTIAGSDNFGGAGIQADLKVFHSLGSYGTNAITAVTVQNSTGVQHIHPIPAKIVVDQIRSLMEDLRPAAVKIGMLVSEDIVDAVSEILAANSAPNVVLDPVITSSSGHELLSDAGVAAMKSHLIPITSIITPNYTETERLTGIAVESDTDAFAAVKCLHDIGGTAVVLTGGHRRDRPVDLLLDQNGDMHWLEDDFQGPDLHGTGCVFSAAIAAHLAYGDSVLNAVRKAKELVSQAIAKHLNLPNRVPALNLNLSELFPVNLSK